jgi:hypothetical protein
VKLDFVYGRHFVCYICYLGWWHISFGVHIHLLSPNIEIHFPGGWARIGWEGYYKQSNGWRPIIIGKQ